MSFETLSHKSQTEFCEQVLNILKKRNVTFYGCKPNRLVLFLDGTAKMMFAGHRNRKQWMGGVKIKGIDIETNIALARPEMLAQVIEEQIDNSKARLDIV